MKTTNKIILTSAFALGLAGAAAGAFADNMPGDDEGEGFGRMGHMCEHRDETRIDMMEAYMESRLELTEAQMPAWDAAVAAVRDAMAAKQAACEAHKDEARPATALEALDRAESHMEAGLEQLKSIRAAVGNLYDVLDADQKATFDAMVKDMRHMRG
jgi:hypothetical protein